MLASKYADTEPAPANDDSNKDPISDRKPLSSLSGNDEKFDWADEPLEPPSKPRRKSRSGTVGSQQVTPTSEKRHSRKKSSVQVPDGNSPSTPTSSTSRKKKQSTAGAPLVEPLIDLSESPSQGVTTSPKKLSRAEKGAEFKSQPQPLIPAKPDPSAQPKPSTPDIVRRTSTPTSAPLPAAKKVMSKRGRPCLIRVPNEEEDESRRRHPWTKEQYLLRFQSFAEDGYNTQGYDQTPDNEVEGHYGSLYSQNCAVFPDPAEAAEEKARGREQGRFEIVIPDKRKWDEYMNQMMEDKLKALGVKPVGDEESGPAPTPATEDTSRRESASFPSLANSPPPLSSSVNSQHQWPSGLPFSAASFSPAAFTSNTSVGALGSPGPSQPAPGRPGHLSRQSTFGLPFQASNLNPSLGSNQNLQQQFSNINVPSQSVTPLPGSIQRIPSGLSRASPDLFGLDRSQTQTPRMQANNMRTSSALANARRGTLRSEQSFAFGTDMSSQGSQQGRHVATPEPPLQVQQNTYGELAYPTPRGHRHNISQNLEREAENAQYYPGEYVNEERTDSEDRRQIDSRANSSRAPSGPPMPSHRSGPSHASKASSSGFNVDAKEFKFEPKASHAKNSSIAKNPFVPAHAGGASATKPAVSLLTAHANGETTGGGNFNAAAPVFQPPKQGNFNFSSTFDFSAKKPDQKPDPSKEDDKKEPGPKIFSSINVSGDIVKPAKKSKAIPIVNPDAMKPVMKSDIEPQEDEAGRLGQNRDRFKRSKPTMLDGQNEPKFDLPKDTSFSNKVNIPTSLPKLDNKIDEKDSEFEEAEKELWHDVGTRSRKRDEPETSKQDKPARGTYIPPHKRKNTVQDAETNTALQRPAAQEASEKLAKEANVERQRSLSKSPRFPPGSLSPTFQEIDATIQNLDGEPNFGVQQDLENKLPPPVKSPIKQGQLDGDSPELRESKLTAFQNGPTSRSPAVSTEWLQEQQRSMRTSASPVRKLVGTKDIHVSDWDDMLDSGDETKLVPHAQFFDTRIKSLIEGVLQQHLSPLQKSLKEVDSHIRATPKEAHGAIMTATEKTDSDADDEEDNVDDMHPPRHVRGSNKKLDQIRNIINEAVKPLAMGNTALPDASEIRVMIDEGIKSLEKKDLVSIHSDQLRSIVEAAITSSDLVIKGALEVERIEQAVAESVKAFGPPPAPIFDAEQIRSLIVEAVKSSTPADTPAAEFDAEHMKFVVTETIKAFGVASSSIEPDQMRSIVTEAIKASTPSVEPAFDPEHMKLVVAETIKAFGTPQASIDPEHVRSTLVEAFEFAKPAPEQLLDPEHMRLVVAETVKAFGTPTASIDQEHMRSAVTEAFKASVPANEQVFDPEHMRLVVAETMKAFGTPVASIDREHMRSVVSEAFKASTPAPTQAFDPEHMQLVVAETVKALSGTTASYDPEEVRNIVTEAVKSSTPAAFDPDEIRAIVKEVVNFSKAGESTQLEPEHFRSIVAEAIATSGIKEAIDSLNDTSSREVAKTDERLQSESHMRIDAEQRAKDLQKLLDLSEKEINLLKESSVGTESSLKALRDDKQSTQEHIAELEKVERELKASISGKTNQIAALEGTLDEYRTSSTRWRHDLDSEKQLRAGMQMTIDGLRQNVVDHKEESDHLKSKNESLQEKLAGVARNFTNERESNLKKTDEIQTLSSRVETFREKLQFASKTQNAQQEASRAKEEEATKELAMFSARLEEELRIRQRLESNLQAMAEHERHAIKASVQLEETRLSNDRLTAEVQKLRQDNIMAQNDISMREREAIEAKDIARSEIQRSKTLLEADMQVAKRKFDGVRTDLETRLAHVREELVSAKRDAEQQRTDFNRRLDESNQARTAAVRQAAEQSNVTRNEERNRFERMIGDLARENDRAMRRALDDHQRAEVHFREALKVKDEKLQLLEEKCKHLEDKVTVAQSAAQAAATAAQQRQQAQTQVRENLRPSERVSPQALRESIAVLQEQLQERESRIDSLESERAELTKAAEAEKKLTARDTEISWLRELLGVRVDDLTELVNLLSGEGYDRIETRDAAIRIRTNLQMEQQEKERLITQFNKSAGLPASSSGRPGGVAEQGREMLRDVSNFATPRAAQIAAVWGNWRRGQASPSLSSIRDAVANPSTTPSRREARTTSTSSAATDATQKVVNNSATAAQTFLSGLMTPPASNYVRRTPTPSSSAIHAKNERKSSFTADGRELDAQPLNLSLEDELEAAGGDENDTGNPSPEMSPTRMRPSRVRAPQPGVSVMEGEDPLRTPIRTEASPSKVGKSVTILSDDALDAPVRPGKSLDDELGGIGEGDEVARDAVVSPLGPPEGEVGL